MFSLFRPVLYLCSVLSMVISVLMAIVALFGWWRNDAEFMVFLLCAAGIFLCGLIVHFLVRSPGNQLVARQLYLMTSLGWMLMALCGALPLFFSHYELSFTDALFEAVSGITTTGSTVLSGIEQLSPSLLLWRSMLQWLGGLGVIGMAVSILPFLRIGGMRLFHTESSDWSDKSMPRLQSLARLLVLTYLGLSLACTAAYWLAGMSVFDAVNHAMTTVSTGGYATDDRSMGRFGAPILWIAIAFMLLGAMPFTLIISFLRRPRWHLLLNSQVLTLLGIVAAVSLLLSSFLILGNDQKPFHALTHATFNLVSVITTTGYASSDYTQWGNVSIALFFFVMFIGGCSGSTSGGMKIFRFELSYRFLRSQVRKLIHPNGVFTTQYNGRTVDDDIMHSAVAFSFLFFICLAVLTLFLAALGLDLVTSLSSAATALTNVGPGLGDIVGPAGNFAPLPDAAKWLLCFGMLLGRLELLTLMVLLTPVFWRG
ncbi:TrkH family potassium uptake protein [Halopseudomonas salegens]|uniref:Trk system potassium uptake protein n=1 Tax=Halopseudomonas salegens TaxID=1434072 RepID=A0A1H2HX67_9GAMM|nr:TrkH family potassium uptake protein [Halopseudomonas salegens]SDU36374.1 trk system potassium uptake protein TrkH [Halopseudomonas salegens]